MRLSLLLLLREGFENKWNLGLKKDFLKFSLKCFFVILEVLLQWSIKCSRKVDSRTLSSLPFKTISGLCYFVYPFLSYPALSIYKQSVGGRFVQQIINKNSHIYTTLSHNILIHYKIHTSCLHNYLWISINKIGHSPKDFRQIKCLKFTTKKITHFQHKMITPPYTLFNISKTDERN